MTVCFLSLPAFNYSPGTCVTVLVSVSVRKSNVAEFSSRSTFVCNLPSLRTTAPTLVTQSVWIKLHLRVLQLCRVCWRTAEMWLFTMPTWLSNQSLCADVRRKPLCRVCSGTSCTSSTSFVKGCGRDGYGPVCI